MRSQPVSRSAESTTSSMGRVSATIAKSAIALAALIATTGPGAARDPVRPANPIFRDAFTADPAPLVVGDRLYVYAGHDQAHDGEMFNISEWLAYSTTDMKTWTAHGPIMKPTDFTWATQDAWAAQVVRHKRRYWLYAPVRHDKTHPGMAIGVAVSDSPTGPFVDAKGSALITDATTPGGKHPWNDIDPTVFIDGDGTAWLAWGNGNCFLAKLKPNMIELDGPIRDITPRDFEEGPWLHKRGKLYYLTYASLDRSRFPNEHIAYATATSMAGPWTYRGELTGEAYRSFTIHPGITQFKDNWYLFYHDASLTLNGQAGALGRRAVAVQPLTYNPDGTMQPVVQSPKPVSITFSPEPR
jgi:beta-xylosidase